MPAQFTLPPDTRAVGSPDPANDMNAVIDALTAMGATLNVLNAAYSGGADPAGTNDSTSAIQAALNAVPAGGGVVYLPPGTYKVTSTLTSAVTPTYIQGAGRWATDINFTGTGDCIRMFNPLYGAGGKWGGGVTGLYITGASAGAGSCGLHIGDGEQYYLDLAVEHFNGAGSIGIHLDNAIWWTEKAHGTIFARDCTSHVVFDVTAPYAYASTTLVSAVGGVATFTNAGGWNIPGTTTALQSGMLLLGSAGLTTPTSSNVSTLSVTSVSGTTLTCAYTGTAPSGTSGTLTLVSSTNSFGYLDLTCYLYAQPNQDGVVVQGGAFPYHGNLAVKGNFQGSASAVSNAVLRATGTVPTGHTGAGLGSQIGRCHLDIQAETQTAANQPTTIIMNSVPANAILGCYGILDFTQGSGSFTASNVTVSQNAGSFTYEGIIAGDAALNPPGTTAPVTIGAKSYAQSFLSGSNGNMFTQWGDFFSATLSANITISIGGGTAGLAGPQRKTIIIKQAAAGGPFTVTWPHAGSPTTSSPTVLWAGGTAPTMTSTANAVDVYKLETVNGATWYGQAIQNVS